MDRVALATAPKALLLLLGVLVAMDCNAILGAELGVLHGDGGLDPAAGVIDPAAGVIDSAAGVIDSAAGVIDSAAGVIDSAAGAIDSAAGVIQPAASGIDAEGGAADVDAGELDSGRVVGPDSSTDANVAPSGAKDITVFTILGVDGAIVGTSIRLKLPKGTSLKSLTPTVTITGVSVEPRSGVPKNFTHPVTYTVTAADGSTKAYTAAVTASTP